MKFEGEYRDGKVNGNGLLTFADGTHGLPRNEGLFQGTRFIERKKCPEIVQRAQRAATIAKAQHL
ncbi:MORN repeat-containing protein 4 homolog [Saccoglossus kowalevskii]